MDLPVAMEPVRPMRIMMRLYRSNVRGGEEGGIAWWSGVAGIEARIWREDSRQILGHGMESSIQESLEEHYNVLNSIVSFPALMRGQDGNESLIWESRTRNA